MAKDYYAILGVDKNATQEDIKKAFRTIAKQTHPDSGEGSDANKFKEANEAYGVLFDTKKRADYDLIHGRPSGGQYRSYDYSGNPFQYGRSPFQDDFSSFWDGFDPKARHISQDVSITAMIGMDIAYYGTKTSINFDRLKECKNCSATGIIKDNSTPCPHCKGSGRLLGGTTICHKCSGIGKKTSTCSSCGGHGKSSSVAMVDINIPPHSPLGSRIIIPDAGNILHDGRKGKLIVLVMFGNRMEDVMHLLDGTLVKSISVPWDTVLMGERYEFKIFSSGHDSVSLLLDPTLPEGNSYRLSGLGMSPNSDLLVKVNYSLPSNIREEDRILIAKVLRNAKSEASRGHAET